MVILVVIVCTLALCHIKLYKLPFCVSKNIIKKKNIVLPWLNLKCIFAFLLQLQLHKVKRFTIVVQQQVLLATFSQRAHRFLKYWWNKHSQFTWTVNWRSSKRSVSDSLGMPETSFRGLRTRTALRVRRSTGMFMWAPAVARILKDNTHKQKMHILV